MPTSFLLKVVELGGKEVVNDYLYFDELDDRDDLTKHLRTVIKERVVSAKRDDAFEASDEQILEIIGKGGVNIRSMLDRPLSVFPRRFDEIKVKIIICSAQAEEEEDKDEEMVDLVDENTVVTSFLESEFTIDEIEDFQQRYSNRSVGRQTFLQRESNTPTYDQQLDTAIKHIMKNPVDGMRPCGYKERRGDKNFREKQISEAVAAANNLEDNETGDSTTKPVSKIETSTECNILQTAVRKFRECVKFVHDHRETLENRDSSLFNTPILNQIKNADPGGTSVKNKRFVRQMTQKDISKQLLKISEASRALPKWYHDKINSVAIVAILRTC